MSVRCWVTDPWVLVLSQYLLLQYLLSRESDSADSSGTGVECTPSHVILAVERLSCACMVWPKIQRLDGVGSTVQTETGQEATEGLATNTSSLLRKDPTDPVA